MAGGVSKTSKAATGDKGGAGRGRMLNGKPVKPVLYAGSAIGRSNYMTGSVDGQMVLGPDGFPLPLQRIGDLH